MCGIVGAVAERNVTPILLEGLRRLEYRGYDSAGIAVLDNDDCISRVRMHWIKPMSAACWELHIPAGQRMGSPVKKMHILTSVTSPWYWFIMAS